MCDSLQMEEIINLLHLFTFIIAGASIIETCRDESEELREEMHEIF
jgi:hypothetical protein